MAPFLCCLVSSDAAALLFNERPSSRWTFQAEMSADCDLPVRDADTQAGSRAWHEADAPSVRAMATASADPAHGLVLRKPLRGPGPDGLIHILNEAA